MSGSTARGIQPAPPASLEPALGELIRDLRRARGLTLQELADRIGKSVGYLSQVERNKSTLSIAALMDISRALGVPMNWFFQVAAINPRTSATRSSGKAPGAAWISPISGCARNCYRRTCAAPSNCSSASSNLALRAARSPTAIRA
jgi:transcriptional regulator with XRE-family HTH domain